MRGLTREQVIRMAKKSDASKRVLKDYESPSGSTELLDPNQPVYLLNQQEMDEELKHFRAFFAQSTPPTTSTPTTEEGASTSLETTDSFIKRETLTSVTKTQFSSFSSRTDQSSVVHERYEREQSTSSTFQKAVGTSPKLQETAIDSSLEELEQRADEHGSDASSKPTAVVIVA